MQLSQIEIEELAGFFGRRLDPTLTPAPAPRNDEEERRRTAAWRMVLEEADEKGRLNGLFTVMRRKHAGDAQLVAALDLLLEPGTGADKVLGAVLATTAMAGVACVLTGVTGGGAAVWYAMQEPIVTQHQTLGQISLATVETGPDVGVERAEARIPTGRCTVPDGGHVGFWYAGSNKPGGVGDLVHTVGNINVRTDLPTADNGYFTGSHIRCVLQPGDRIRLSAEPVKVAGGAWWVPLTTGDLLPTG